MTPRGVLAGGCQLECIGLEPPCSSGGGLQRYGCRGGLITEGPRPGGLFGARVSAGAAALPAGDVSMAA